MFDDLIPGGAATADPFAGLPSIAPGIKPGDLIKSAGRGVLKVPGALTGLADIPGALLLGDRYADKLTDKVGDLTGFKPGHQAKDIQFSPGAQVAQAELDTAWKQSGADRLGNALINNQADLPEAWRQADLAAAGKAIVQNPGAAFMNVVESIPSMLVGGAIGKGLAVAGKVAPIIAGAAGEGLISAGSQMDAIDPSVDPRKAAGSALAAGAGTALIAGVGGKLAQKAGFEDLQTAMAGGRADNVGRGAVSRIGGGAVSEAGQEFLQSGQEQIWQNYAEDKPLGQGVIRGATEGAVAGGIMGGGANLRSPASAVVPRADGQGDTIIDPAAGPLSAAAAEHVHRNDALSTAATTGDLFGDMAPVAPIEQALDPLFDAPEPSAAQPDQLAEFAAQVEPIALAEAQSMLQQSRAAGYDGHAIAQHPAGGYMVVPREWLTVEQVQPVEQAIGAPETSAAQPNQLADFAAEVEPVSFDEAQTIAVQGSGAHAVIEHPAGGGYLVVPKEWLPATTTDPFADLVPANSFADQVASLPANEQRALAKRLGVTGFVTAKNAEEKILNEHPDDIARALAGESWDGKRWNAAEQAATIDQAASVANTAPSEAQKAAGNYAKGHIKVGPLDIAIENPAGSTRTGPGWTTKMSAHYGYVKRTTGNDGDQVDVYVKEGTAADHSGPVFVVDQFDPATGKFDEQKAMLGYASQIEAQKAYDAHFSDNSGPRRRQGITEMSADEFKSWAQTGDTSKPAATNATIRNERTTNDQIRYNQAGEDAQQPPLAEQGRYRDVPENGAGAGVDSRPGQAPRASYGQARQGAVTVVGVHYSGAERQSLSSAFYGTGIKGAEAVRLQSLPEHYRYRTYFYVNEGQGVFPESGVGAHAHEVELVNLYDARQDALDLAKSHRGDFNAFEMAIVEAGFDGYYVPEGFGRQGVAALLGPHTVPVTHKGVGYRGQDAQRPQQAPTETDADKIAAMRNLPMGKMTGADWKRMVNGVDLSHLDDAKTYYRDQIAYTVKEPDTISGDLFIGTEHAIPQTTGKALSRQGKATHRRAGASSNVIALRQAPDVEGVYHVTTQLVTVGERHLPVGRVGSWEDAAKVFANLSRYAVEHFDALVTDKNGKPLAIIGGFKGAPTQASVYPGTVMMELARIDGAANLWMAHNHPSGTPDLSNADRSLSGTFEKILEGSNVQYRGLAAVARQGANVAWTTSDYSNGSVTAEQPAKFKVPMVEREITESNPVATVSSPITAKSLVATIAKDQPGVLFLTSQNGVSAFVPFDPKEMGELRTGDRLMRLFRAASKAAGTGALVAMPDGKVTGQQFANLKGALGTVDIKVLDGIEYDTRGTGKVESLAEKGIDLSAGTNFYRQGTNPGNLDDQIFALAWSGQVGSDTILDTIARDSATPFNRELAKILKAKGFAAKVKIAPFAGTYAGMYNLEKNEITLYVVAGAEATFLHEMVHAATLQAVANESVATGRMRRLLRQVREELGEGTHYGLSTTAEFVAEAFSNPEFQKALKGIQVTKSKLASLWSEFVGTVRMLLGLDAKRETALGRAIELGVQMMQETLDSKSAPTNFAPHFKMADRPTVKDWLGHQLANNRGWALGALTRDQLADIYGKTMPEVTAFDRVVQAMDQERQTIAEKADTLVERWRKLPGQVADSLADIMHTATLEQFDPDLRSDVQTPEQSIMLKEWKALSPEAQQFYRDVRDQYAATLAKLQRGLVKRAERTDQRTAAAIRLEFDKYLAEGPYFPLARFGDFILIAEKNEERTVEAFESSAVREKRARQLRMKGWKTKLTAKKDYSASKDGPAGEFVGQVLKLVDGLAIEAKEKTDLMDSLNQLAIGSLPGQSYRKHFAHRKGTPGFSKDAMRAFASSMQHVAHHVSKVLHGDELIMLLDTMNKRISETTGDVDTTQQQQVSNELGKRLDLMMNPTTHPVTAALGQVGFVMSLAGSVASGLTNLSQTALVTYPFLGAKFGFDKSAAALTKAGKDYFGGKWDKFSGFVLKDNPKLSADEKQALNHLEQTGLINLTQAHDLAGAANTDSTQSSRAFAINRAMKIVGWTFHVPEVFNRQASALAAYRLARDAGQDHTAAIEQARQALIRSHFDYSASNRARLMQGNFTRVITMFKQYSQNMTYLLWRSAHQALKGESPEVRREARRMLVGVAAMHFGAAGALGLPLGVFGVTPLLGLLAMGMGDGDDPYDWETEFRNMLADVFGKEGGEVIAHGPLRLLLNVDFASRVGLGDLWIRAPHKEAEGRDLVEAWMVTLLGPVAGYVGNLGTAAKAFDEGKVGRGLEAMLPKFIASPLKAARYEGEGVKSWRGDDLGVALDGGDIFGTALGFNPSKVAEMHEGRAAIKGRETKLMGRREEITNMWNAATLAGDREMQAEAFALAMKFNQANPEMTISAGSLRRSLQAKVRNQALIKDGAYLAKRREDLRAEGRFANVE